MEEKVKNSLDNALIELDELVNEFIDTYNGALIERAIYEMFEDPIGQIESFFGCLPRVYREAPCRRKN